MAALSHDFLDRPLTADERAEIRAEIDKTRLDRQRFTGNVGRCVDAGHEATVREQIQACTRGIVRMLGLLGEEAGA